MAVKMNLWSMTLLPGEKQPMYVRRDFQITNAALGAELRKPDGRSCVLLTHNPVPASALNDSDSDFDSEISSDFDSEDGEEDDEFDVDEDMEDDEEDVEEEGDAETKKKVKSIAQDALKSLDELEGEDGEDEDDEDEDDEDFDSDDEEPVETSVLCTLVPEKIEQAQLNLVFVEGEVVMFEVTGENAVHLMGNYIDQFPDDDSDDESDYDSEDDSEFDDYDALEMDSDSDGPAIEELEEEAEVEVKPKKAVKAAAAAAPAKKDEAAPAAAATLKRKADAVESPAAKGVPATEVLSKAQQKKLAKKAKVDSEAAAPAPAAAAAAQPTKAKGQAAPQKRTTASGLIIEDIKLGTGPVAKGGKRLGMRYIGKLVSGKQFDANTAGKPFSFVLGRGEVIKGWDEGLMGMAVGGERRLTIPPQLGYGKRASGPIPANSTLKFDVKLLSMN